MIEHEPRDPRFDAVVHDHIVENLARNLVARREAPDDRAKREAKRQGILLVTMALGRHLDPYILMREARTLVHDRERAAQEKER